MKFADLKQCELTVVFSRLWVFFFACSEVFGSTNYYKEYASVVPIPRFLEVQTNVVVGEGEMAKLRCRIENLGTKMVSWRKVTDISPLTLGKDTFSPDFRIEVEHEEISETESEWDLIINDVRKRHAGVYECQISARNAYSMNVTLTVLDPKKQKPVITVTGTEYPSLKGKVHLLCNVTGETEAPESVDWFFEGNPIDQMKPKWYGRLQVLNRKPVPGRSFISEIILEQATMSDRGNYVCRSGKLAKSFKVHVLNDTRPYINDPRRDSDNRKISEQGASYSMSDSASVVQHYISALTTVCFVLSSYFLLLHS